MTYRDLMNAFSDCGLGAVLVSEDDTIIDINRAGTELLGRNDPPLGGNLQNTIPFLADEGGEKYGNPVFGRYLRACPTPKVSELPPQTHLRVFQDATGEVMRDILEATLNHMRTAATIWDDQSRMLAINEAAVKLESHVPQDALGRYSEELYTTQNESLMAVPYCLKEKKPVLNLRQDFITHSGKELQIFSDNYPLMKDGRLLGAVSMMEDHSRLDEMNKRIIEMQRNLAEQVKPRQNGKRKESQLTARYCFNDIVYCSVAMRDLVERCKHIAKSDSHVMIYGETGTGKELFAQSIHNASTRSGGPFLAINCAAIPDTLLEALLFGTEKGAYTGAEQREGLFEQANGGTLLLDEINSMNITLQSKLLRVLQEGNFRRVGGAKLIDLDVRVISNINILPADAIEQNLLRKDLYYRLGVINLTIPPLRERKEDIVLLSRIFIATKSKLLLKNVTALDPATLELFQLYDWPGNVRELQHAIEYAMNIIPNESSTITPAYLPEHILKAVNGTAALPGKEHPTNSMDLVMDATGRKFLVELLREYHGNVSQTAQAMGITRQNLQYRMRKFGVVKDEFLEKKA